jgi:hypothetical protein
MNDFPVLLNETMLFLGIQYSAGNAGYPLLDFLHHTLFIFYNSIVLPEMLAGKAVQIFRPYCILQRFIVVKYLPGRSFYFLQAVFYSGSMW